MSTGIGGYVRLVQAAIDREADVLGERRAVELAGAVEGLTVDDGGDVVAIDRSGPAVLGDLIEEYKTESGEIAAFIVARRLENVLAEFDERPALPENIERHL